MCELFATISDAVGSLDGVSEAKINFATDEGSVAYNPEGISLGEIYDAMEEAGYTPATDSVTIAITDMSCANCSETVQDAPVAFAQSDTVSPRDDSVPIRNRYASCIQHTVPISPSRAPGWGTQIARCDGGFDLGLFKIAACQHRLT